MDRQALVALQFDISLCTKWCPTPKLVARIGHRPLRVLVDLGSIGNYIDTQKCVARDLNVKEEESPEELHTTNGSIMKVQGCIGVNFKCGGFKR